jgi:hydrogenase maturation protease
MTVLIGGVGQLFQSDLDLGRRAIEVLAAEDLGPHVAVEELHYGPVAVAQRLEDLRPERLVLVGASARGDAPGTVRRRAVDPPWMDDPAAAQQAIGEAVTGYVAIDLLVEVADGLGALPEDTVAVEVEPAETGPSDQMSPAATVAMERAMATARTEAHRPPSPADGSAARPEPLVGPD